MIDNLQDNKILPKLLSKGFILVRRVAYVLCGFINTLFLGDSSKIVVLCYHSIASDSWRFSINFETLKKQIDYLLKTRKPITVKDLELHISGEKPITYPAFLIAFDDGYQDLLTSKEYFRLLKIKPIVFIIADTKNANRKELNTNRALLTKQEINQLLEAGWDIGCHSLTHPNMLNLTQEEMKKEIIDSKHILEKELGIAINYFAYPKGNYSKKIINEIYEAGYTLAFSMNEGFVEVGTDSSLVPRIGVDRTHSFAEFKNLFSPLVINLRLLIKSIIFPNQKTLNI